MKQENAPAYPALPAHNYKVNGVLLWDEASMKKYLDTWRKGFEVAHSSESAQALAWRTVFDTLTDVYPDWGQLAATGMECATKAIRNLAARAGEKASFVTPSGELKPDVQVHASKVQAELGDCALNLCDPNGPHEKGCYLVQTEPVAAGEYLPLPMQVACSGLFPVYSEEQMRAYADAHRNTTVKAEPVAKPPGIHALMCVISSLRDTAHFSDEEGELTNELRDLLEWALKQITAPQATQPQAPEIVEALRLLVEAIEYTPLGMRSMKALHAAKIALAAPAAPAVDAETIHLQDLKNALADCKALRQQLTLMDEQQAGSVWRWQADGQDQLESMGNRMGVLIRACDLRALLAGVSAPAALAVERGEVLVTVSGFTGSGKSAIAGEIEIMCRALGLQVEWPDSDSEKHMTHADWIAALEQYKPHVRIVECNVPHSVVKGQDK